eukprot:197878_1
MGCNQSSSSHDSESDSDSESVDVPQQKENEDSDAKDISRLPSIKCVAKFPDSNWDISNVYKAEGLWHSGEITEEIRKQEVYLIFDLNTITIDSVSITLVEDKYREGSKDPNKCGTIKLYTSSSYPMEDDPNHDVSQWDLLGIKKHVKKEEIVKFYPHRQHKRYIRIGISKIHKQTKNVCIGSIVWKGFEPAIVDEITDKMAVYQTSKWIPSANASQILLSREPTFWESFESDECFMIFDCGRYEVNRIHILFKDVKSKPHMVKVRLSEICNAYSFQIPSAKTWEFQKFEMNDLLEEIVVNTDDQNVYHSGFKRYLQLRFSKYNASKVGIVCFRFFGTLSEKIPENSEQFDAFLDSTDESKDNKSEELEEKKEDDTAPYRPRVFKNSPPHPHREGDPISNIWDTTSNYFYPRLPGFIIIDSGNNKIDDIAISSHFQYPCSKGAISTSDDPDSNEWAVLHHSDAYHLEEGRRYNISGKHKKYIKLEFDGSLRNDTTFYGIKCVELFGQSSFLTQRNTTTLEDIKTMKIVDKDVVARYLVQRRKDIDVLSTSIFNKHKADPDYDDFGYGPEWIKKSSEYWVKVDAPKQYIETEAYAYTQPTVFEQEERVKIAAMQKQIADEYAMKKAHAISNDNQREKEMGKQLEQIESERDGEKYAKKPDQTTLLKLQKQYDELLAKYRERHDNDESQVVDEARASALEAIYKDTSNEHVYDVWKEAVEHRPLVISDAFSVTDYQAMINWAARHKSAEMSQLWSKLLDLFDESLEQRKILLHKYFIFVLSGQSLRRKPKDPKPCWILLDCEDRKVDRIEFKLKQSSWANDSRTDRIEVYSANEVEEAKVERNGDMETEISWSNFSLVNHVQLEYNIKEGKSEIDPIIPFDQTRCRLNGSHERYLRVVFMDEHGGMPYALTVQQMKVFIESKDEKEVDEDEASDLLPEKYRLKLVGATDAEALPILSNARPRYWNMFSSVYALDEEKTYSSPTGLTEPYLIFDCCEPLKQVEQIAIQFVDGFQSALQSIIISTSNTKDNDDEWTELFADHMAKSKIFVEKYTKEVQIIDIECKNKRYLKLLFVLREDSKQSTLRFLKFCTKNVDENVKKLTSKIKVVEATPSKDDQIVDNIFHSNYRQDYKPRGMSHKPYKNMVADRIRDEVCRAVNQIRGGGTISNDTKHFVKGLLCWKNHAHYHEILDTSKRIMNLLSKTLIEEYAKLQDRNAKLLTLSLDEKHALSKDIVSNHGLLEWDYKSWYQYRKAFFYPNDLEGLAEQWSKLGLPLSDTEFKHLRRTGLLDKEKSFVASDQLAMEYLNLIAYKLDPSFQHAMKDLFEENRKQLNLVYPANNVDLGVLSGPVKTKARQNIKVKLDYYDKPPPQCMAVLDIVRCAVVCETDDELCSLFELINTKFSGKILRIKNAFDDVNKGTYGYRAVLMNIAYGDESLLPKEYQMICEVQLLLLKYYQVRKNMHLGYGIVRSEEGGLSHDRKPYVVLAEDSCKFGKLDI